MCSTVANVKPNKYKVCVKLCSPYPTSRCDLQKDLYPKGICSLFAGSGNLYQQSAYSKNSRNESYSSTKQNDPQVVEKKATAIEPDDIVSLCASLLASDSLLQANGTRIPLQLFTNHFLSQYQQSVVFHETTHGTSYLSRI